MILNLADNSTGIQYKKIKYPDGQISIEIIGEYLFNEHTVVWIKSRFNSYEDMMYILAATEALHNMHCAHICLFIPCFLGQRSDRRFSEGQSFDLKMICKIINAQEYDVVRVYHPHSDVLPALLNNSEVITNQELVAWALKDRESVVDQELVLVSPDAGAYKQVFKYGEYFGRTVVTGNKSRDLLSGNINIDIHGPVSSRHCLIVDDYCDGGKTFVVLAHKLKELGALTVSLCISHGLFSKGIDPLSDVIDRFYCTNSISDIDHYTLKQFKVI